jgi:hypothetical protein
LEPRNLERRTVAKVVKSSQENAASFLALVKPHARVMAIGAAIGALLLAVFGYKNWNTSGALGGLVIGAILGGVSGLDWLLPGPKHPQRLPGSMMGPFRAGASYVLMAIAGLILGLYLAGRLSLECTRDGDGVQCSRVTTGWLNNRETSRDAYGPIAAVSEGGRNQIVITTVNGERAIIDGFDLAAMGQLESFLSSASATMVVQVEAWLKYAAGVWAISLAVGIFGVFTLRSGMRWLRETLETRRASEPT